ncbi:MAG: hypothetical protein EHM46_00550 [Bacteroidetes bacterium]|nr:MAG: hypothetical protein EHM46_00550 [Bacteroidota bacterium]
MKTNRVFAPIEMSEAMAINGGGFAYDLGRVLRFIYLCGGNGLGTQWAIMDWQINEAVNQQTAN